MKHEHVSLATATLLVAVTTANAQSPAPPQLEEIIVTATRIEKPLARVPAAISVINQDDIQLGRQQLALDEALSRVPGVFTQDRFNFAQDLRISIRGFGARANFGIRGVKIVVDGIPETLPDGQGSVDSIDLGASSRIEVLRGPSSSLWGNASGGVISVTTEAAPAEPLSELQVTAGAYDYQKLQFKLGRQGERVDYLFSLSDSAYDGYRTQSRAENTQLTGRFDVDLGEGREFLSVLSYTDQPVSDDPGGVNLAEIAADRRAARNVNVTFDAGESLEQTRIGFVYNMPLGDKHSISARNYYVWRDFANSLPFAAGGIVDLDRFFVGGGLSYTFDGALAGKPDKLIVGVDLDNQDDDRRRYNNNAGIAGALTFDQNESVSSVGIFVQNDLSLTDSIDLSAGVRFDDVEFDVTDRFLADGDDSGVVKLSDVSPMLGIVVGLADDLSLYGTYSTAFETPTTTEFNRPDGSGGFNTALDPQFATNLEVGMRGRFGGRRHSYEVALFNIKVDDELVPFEVPSSPGRVYYENAGKSNRDGIELGVELNPTDRVRATFSYTHSAFEFDTFVDEGGNDYAGNRIPGLAEEVLFAELMYRHERGWFAAFDVLYNGDQYADNANTTKVDGYALANLRFGIDLDLPGLVVAPFFGINNLFDEDYYGNIRINAFGARYYEPAPGQNIYAGVRVNFRRR